MILPISPARRAATAVHRAKDISIAAARPSQRLAEIMKIQWLTPPLDLESLCAAQ
jgi:hypothetical protein